jgi:hypothetical protein
MFYLLPWALSARARQFQAMATGVDLRFNQWTQNTRRVRARTDKRSMPALSYRSLSQGRFCFYGAPSVPDAAERSQLRSREL